MAVLALDPSAFPKKGNHSVGVKQQWCGRLGKVENCQVGVFLAYVSRREQALVNMRLYLPKEWANDRKRRKECGVPREVRYQTRHHLALEMLDEHGPLLPHAWVTGDDEMGLPAWFRRELRQRGERYLVGRPGLRFDSRPGTRAASLQSRSWAAAESAIPTDTAMVPIVARGGLAGNRSSRRGKGTVDRGDRHAAGGYDVGGEGRGRRTVGRRSLDRRRSARSVTITTFPMLRADTPLEEFARVARAEHRIEQCFERGKTDAGLAEYQVRTWLGWHHHVTLSLLATWFLIGETRRGKKMDTRDYRSPGPQTLGSNPAERLRLRYARPHPPRMHALAAT